MKSKKIFGIVGRNLVATSFSYEDVLMAQMFTEDVHYKDFTSFKAAKQYVIQMFHKINNADLEDEEIPYNDLVFFDDPEYKYYGIAGNYSLGVVTSPIALRMYYDYFENIHVQTFDNFEDAEKYAIDTYNSLHEGEYFNEKLIKNYIFTQI